MIEFKLCIFKQIIDIKQREIRKGNDLGENVICSLFTSCPAVGVGGRGRLLPGRVSCRVSCRVGSLAGSGLLPGRVSCRASVVPGNFADFDVRVKSPFQRELEFGLKHSPTSLEVCNTSKVSLNPSSNDLQLFPFVI